MSENIENGLFEKKEQTTVLTVRIERKIDQILDEIKSKRRLTKANVIRNYLEMVKYLNCDQNSIRSKDDRDLIIIKRNSFRKFLESFEEEVQMYWGIKIAQFINDLARVQNEFENIEYKLDLCEHFGFFSKFIDKENYILFSKKFGPNKFVEAFAYKLINYSPDDEYDINFTTKSIEDSSKLRGQYNKVIQPIYRTDGYYAYMFAKLERYD